MKGILICGGTGTRLRPLTEITNKSLLPVYDRPLILYPLDVLKSGGIRDIIVISGPEHMDQMAAFLGSGERFDCRMSYCVQEKPGGIAQALGLAESFADQDDVCAILGDNVFFDDLGTTMKAFKGGAHLFLKEVPDPERFGVATMQGSTIIEIEEKPTKPKSNLAVTGCYLYDHRCFDVIRNMKPSSRGELEITDVSRWYVEQEVANATMLQQEWVDAGTFESLYRASSLVREKKLR